MTSRRGTFLAALVTASLIPLAPPALAIPATDGHLTWGIAPASTTTPAVPPWSKMAPRAKATLSNSN